MGEPSNASWSDTARNLGALHMILIGLVFAGVVVAAVRNDTRGVKRPAPTTDPVENAQIESFLWTEYIPVTVMLAVVLVLCVVLLCRSLRHESVRKEPRTIESTH